MARSDHLSTTIYCVLVLIISSLLWLQIFEELDKDKNGEISESDMELLEEDDSVSCSSNSRWLRPEVLLVKDLVTRRT